MSMLQIKLKILRCRRRQTVRAVHIDLLNVKYREKYFESLHKKYIELVSIRIGKYKTVVIFSKSLRL